MKLDVFAQTLTVSIFFSRLLTKAGAHDYISRSATKNILRSLHTYDQSPEETLNWDNGALPLVLSVLADNIVSDMSRGDDTVEGLTQTQTDRLADKLKGIYAHLLDHPALMERRLYVGSKRPEIHPHPRLKRTFANIGQHVCPERAEWERLRNATDVNDKEVEVLQPEMGPNWNDQWFYTVTCDNHAFYSKRECPGCCMGIDHNKYNSFCNQKKNYVMALIRRPSGVIDWTWIQVNSGCSCAILEKFDPIFDL